MKKIQKSNGAKLRTEALRLAATSRTAGMFGGIGRGKKANAKPEFSIERAVQTSIAETLEKLASTPEGLSETEATARLLRYGANDIAHERPPRWYVQLLQAFNNTFIYLLGAPALVSYLTDDMSATEGDIRSRQTNTPAQSNNSRINSWLRIHLSSRKMKSCCELIFTVFGLLWISQAQTPFTTDDAGVTDKGKFHFELCNEYARLQKSLYPSRRQNTANSRFTYGLTKNVEIGVDVTVVTIFNARGTVPPRHFGFSDTILHVKVKLREEKEKSRMPALAAAFYVYLPTGDDANSLGSGITNYHLYGVAQKSITEKTKVRLNAGILFAGNTVVDVPGVRTAKGNLFSGGASIVKQYTEKLRLGAELTGVVSSDPWLNRGQLRTTVGGNYNLKKNLTLDFGFSAGRFPASPRVGGLLGFTVDF